MGIGAKIKAISKEKGMTLKEIADKSGVSYNTIYSITKRDSERVQGDIIARISKALDISPSVLLITDSSSNVDGIVERILDEFPHSDFSPGSDDRSFRLSLNQNLKEALLSYFSDLNPTGQAEAVKRVEELTEIPKYQKEK